MARLQEQIMRLSQENLCWREDIYPLFCQRFFGTPAYGGVSPRASPPFLVMRARNSVSEPLLGIVRTEPSANAASTNGNDLIVNGPLRRGSG
jgi:hypothetical protein